MDDELPVLPEDEAAAMVSRTPPRTATMIMRAAIAAISHIFVDDLGHDRLPVGGRTGRSRIGAGM